MDFKGEISFPFFSIFFVFLFLLLYFWKRGIFFEGILLGVFLGGWGDCGYFTRWMGFMGRVGEQVGKWESGEVG